jgi:hypothetical protein
MHKSATKCNETVGKWCKNKHGASKIIDTLETYQPMRQREKKGDRVSIRDFCLTGPQAVFPAWARVCPGALFFFSNLFSFSFLFFFLWNFAKRSQIDSNQF